MLGVGFGTGLGIARRGTTPAGWWLAEMAGAARISDYKNGRYMSQGSPVVATVLSAEARNTPQTVTNADGTLTSVAAQELAIGAGIGLQIWESRINLLTADPIASEMVTVIDATEHTLSLAGTGSATLSGAGAGVATDGSPVIFTTTSTSLTVTLSGSPGYLWLEKNGFAGPALTPSITRDAGDVTVVQGFGPLGSNLYTGQAWSVISGVTQDATHLIYDGTADSASLAVRITGLSILQGDEVEISYEIQDYVAGEIGLSISLNPSPTKTFRNSNGIFTETLTAGSTQADRIIFDGNNDFEGKILLSSISVRKIPTLAFPGQNGTQHTRRIDWDADGVTGDRVLYTESKDANDYVQLHFVSGVLRLESFVGGVSQGFVTAAGADDGNAHAAVMYWDSGSTTIKLSIDGSVADMDATVTIPIDLTLIEEGHGFAADHINGNIELTAQANGDYFNAWAGL